MTIGNELVTNRCFWNETRTREGKVEKGQDTQARRNNEKKKKKLHHPNHAERGALHQQSRHSRPANQTGRPLHLYRQTLASKRHAAGFDMKKKKVSVSIWSKCSIQQLKKKDMHDEHVGGVREIQERQGGA
jgi:hypothetical protein